MAEYVFDKFRPKAFQICNTAALSMYSTGRVSGLVVESGESLTYTVPVFEGYALPHAMMKLDIAGQDVTDQLIKELEQGGTKVKGYRNNIRELKE